MAKRVAAERRGMLYGMIVAIAIAVIMIGVTFYLGNQLQESYKIIEANTIDMQTARANVDKMRRNLEAEGVLPASQSLSVSAAITALDKQCNDYKAAIGELAFCITGKTVENIQGQALLAQVSSIKAESERALVKATESLTKIPQGGVEGAEAKKPTFLVDAIVDLGLHVDAARTAYDKKVEEVKARETTIATKDAEIKTVQDTLQANFEKAKTEAAASIAGLEKKVTEVQGQADQSEKERDAAREAYNKAVATHAVEKQKLTNELVLRDSTIAEFSARIQRALARQFEPDGKIIKLAPGEKTGYANLGKGDGAFNGLTFAVFDPTELGKSVPQPKGHIRLTNVMAESAEFFIENQEPGSTPIVEGDLITNPAFDRQRHFHFTVVGIFDLTGIGTDDINVVKDLIRRTGGIVDDKVTVETDYLVVGKDPMSAMPIAMGGVVTPQQQAMADKLQQQQKAFGLATDMAERVHIPVLTQNRFLSLVGFVPGKTK